ncbi:hypothetical protein CYLTODRAFT_132161 [Cylindrobasidium torrendii FP15055 ss-10]|uniref:Uncharacterized protein n=1 Tax=Cylindrobasidium torrendii FP15055 ss-10 TaxID=1314674 RepID=A0A0D7AYZ3_9AGAR|nr:hypothetical protein CYLTODRAFT_132161 [Cylindrobasidium torrendii FP15055 ss-10]
MSPPPLPPPIIKRRSRQEQRDSKRDMGKTPKIKSEEVTVSPNSKKTKPISGPGSSKDKAIVLSDDEGGTADAPIEVSSDDDITQLAPLARSRAKRENAKKVDRKNEHVKKEDVKQEVSKKEEEIMSGEGTANKPIQINSSDSEDEEEDDEGEKMEEVQEEDGDAPPDPSQSPSPEPGRVPNPGSIFNGLDPEDYENEDDSIVDGTDGYDSIMGPPSGTVSRVGMSASRAGWGAQDGENDESSENSEMEVENSLIVESDD